MKKIANILVVILVLLISIVEVYALRPASYSRQVKTHFIEKDGLKIRISEHGQPIIIPDNRGKGELKEIFVLNPGAVKVGQEYYLAIRSTTKINHSKIIFATSRDGYNFTRIPNSEYTVPIPEGIEGGAEDPRLCIVGEHPDRIFMHYTYAHDGKFEIAQDWIMISDFLSGNYGSWHGRQPIFSGTLNKDFVLIPRRINGKYYAYHRPELPCRTCEGRSINLAVTDDLIAGEWKDLGPVLIPTENNWLGAGCVVETEAGWFLYYHQARFLDKALDKKHYESKLALMQSDNPGKPIYQLDDPVLTPVNSKEIKMIKKLLGYEPWVPYVKFHTGAIIDGPSHIAKKGDKIILYYGLGDTIISAATSTIEALPEPQRLNIIRPLQYKINSAA